jgi:hypothetical protein
MTWKTNQFNHLNYQFPIEVQCSFTIGLHHTYPTTKTYEKIPIPQSKHENLNCIPYHK